MRAIAQEGYGPPQSSQLKQVDTPAVGEGDVLLHVRAAGVNPLDWHYVRGVPYVARIALGMSKAKLTRRGVDVAGLVEAVGSGVQLVPARMFSAGATGRSPSTRRLPPIILSKSRAA